MRIRIVQRLILAGLAGIGIGLFSVQVVHGPAYRDKAERNRTRLIHLPAARGTIFDRHGIPLAEDRMSFELAVLPQELRSPDQTWQKLSGWVGVPAGELARRYQSGFTARFAPVTVARGLRRETAFLMEEERVRLPGILVRPVPQRHYPLGPAVGAVVGHLGLIGPEELTRLKAYGYTHRDWVGKDGVEKRYDAVLRGRDGGLSVEVNAQGRLVQQMGFLSPERGRDITLSIDSRLQELGYGLLGGSDGAVLVMDSASGEILALVSSPGFDPNAFVDSGREEEVRRILRDPDRPLFNRAVRAVIPPGSSFKPAVAYEALKEGKIAPGTAFECTGRFKLGRSTFRCWQEEGHSFQTVAEALEHSCNVFFYQAGRQLGPEGIARAARLFRLDRETGIDLPWEAKGLVPDPAWMRQAYRQPWQEGDTLSFAIGQGALQVTPLGMLALFNGIATHGRIPQPHLRLDIPGQESETGRKPRLLLQSEEELLSSSRKRGSDSRFRLPVRQAGGNDDIAQLPLEDAALSRVRLGLERVVQSETGTGRLAQVPGIRVSGKTGTAQAPQGPPHAWFCGYAPAENPKVSFIVFLEHGGKGGLRPAQMAGQLVAHLKEMEYL